MLMYNFLIIFKCILLLLNINYKKVMYTSIFLYDQQVCNLLKCFSLIRFCSNLSKLHFDYYVHTHIYCINPSYI